MVGVDSESLGFRDTDNVSFDVMHSYGDGSDDIKRVTETASEDILPGGRVGGRVGAG